MARYLGADTLGDFPGRCSSFPVCACVRVCTCVSVCLCLCVGARVPGCVRTLLLATFSLFYNTVPYCTPLYSFPFILSKDVARAHYGSRFRLQYNERTWHNKNTIQMKNVYQDSLIVSAMTAATRWGLEWSARLYRRAPHRIAGEAADFRLY